jgi:hypothetical protein
VQDIIDEAMASIHCVAASPAAEQQQEKVVESEGTCDPLMAASLPTPSGSADSASFGAVSAAPAAHETPADSHEDNSTLSDNPNTPDKAPAGSTNRLTPVLVLLFGMLAAPGIIAYLMALMLPSTVVPTPLLFVKAPTPAFAAKEALPMSSYVPYVATVAAPTAPVSTARAASNKSAASAARAAAANGSPAAAAAAAPVNLMLSCPKEWQCRYPKPQLAPWLAGQRRNQSFAG